MSAQRIGIIIQARMGSTRLPGKVMKDLAGKTVLWHDIERCKASKKADAIVIATSDQPQDDIIAESAQTYGVQVYRGSESDVLSRYYYAAQEFKFDIIVRITSDCPLIDSEIIDACITQLQHNDVDYVSNCLERIFPRGLDCEVFTNESLSRAQREATDMYDREHVTPYIIRTSRVAAYRVPDEYQGDYRLTLDTEDDYKLLNQLYVQFYKPGETIDVRRVIRYLDEHPEIASINQDVQQKSSIGGQNH